MVALQRSWRFRRRVCLVPVVFILVSLVLSFQSRAFHKPVPNDEPLERRFPLAWKYIHLSNGTGGAWYIPPEWAPAGDKQPKNIVQAARLASDAAREKQQRQMSFSNIPLLVHQTWKTTEIETWSDGIISSIERWLEYAVSIEKEPMAYFFWDDDGMRSFVQEFEPDFVDDFMGLFSPVTRADIFRILVCKWLGGIYGDVDTEPLKPPATWVRQSDLKDWSDEKTGTTYGWAGPVPESMADSSSVRPVNLLLGIEADTDPDSDTYWRMGYGYPLQLTQWALASAPQHPVLNRFMDNLARVVQATRDKASTSDNVTDATRQAMKKLDPLSLTGPEAVTLAAKSWLAEQAGLRWNALTGLDDGGRSKLVSDVLILPITAFSPGRGTYGNMGSKDIHDPDARLVHHAQGSWRKFNFMVEYGKFCRTVFGLCKDWSKVTA
ncbi:glycosyltransferase family 32 protein [Thozetella sp. PMI_491]|nr:glycosyltransferase family 32 protein [Thozetella sp. PMI_491]